MNYQISGLKSSEFSFILRNWEEKTGLKLESKTGNYNKDQSKNQ